MMMKLQRFMIGMVVVMALAPAAPVGAGSVPVQESSFETVGDSQGGGWYSFPTGNPWGVDPAAPYRILLQNSGHFAAAADGTKACNLLAVDQNLQTTVGSNADVTLIFSLGRSENPGNDAQGTAAVWMAIGGTVFASNEFNNGDTKGAFVERTLTGNTANATGDLSIAFANISGVVFLDKVAVSYTTLAAPPEDTPVVDNATGATDITQSSAYLTGTLTSTGTSATAVFVLWGPNNGATNWANWAHTNVWTAPQDTNAFTIQVTGLDTNTTYYYRFAATNASGTTWAPATAIFTTAHVNAQAFGVVATGGTTTDLDGYRIHTFTSSGTLTVTSGGEVEVLVVAGGGGGGGQYGGGGGAGGLLYYGAETPANGHAEGTGYVVTSGSNYTVTVGGGGSGGNDARGGLGQNSVFGALIAYGGGGGGKADGVSGLGGGSGGGAANTGAPGTGLTGQGFDGGAAGYGGGGGAGQAGASGSGKGGDGLPYAIAGGGPVYYAGGGGGAGGGGSGQGGGGSSLTDGAAGTAGTDGLGGGGGGGWGGNGGKGGSGVVIVRYALDTTIPAVDNAIGATNITLTSADLTGTLSSTGTSATAVFVFWGPSNGGTNWENWAHTNVWPAPQATNAFTVQITGLDTNTTYYYRFAATNASGTTWAPATAIFMTGHIDPPTFGIVATGGIISEVDGYRIHTFTNNGTLTVTSGGEVEVLVVGGGGGGSDGGGGAGGLAHVTGYALSTGSYDVAIGNGGSGSMGEGFGGNGGDSRILGGQLAGTQSYRFLRWRVTARRNPTAGGNYAAASEFQVTLAGSPVSWPSGTTVSNPGGSNPGGEGPGNLIDGNGGTKWLDLSFDNVLSIIDIDCGAGNSVVFDGYRYSTTDDPTRDPVTWILYGSNDGTTYDVIGIVTSASSYGVFSLQTCLLGYGGGGGGPIRQSGRSGGSGGGAGPEDGGTKGSGGPGIVGQGHAGGSNLHASGYPSGGGGGAGEAGHDTAGAGISGAGGDGLRLSISGADVWYAGGGGGNNHLGGGTPGAGGAGGGGTGGGHSGSPNTGGGGGGGTYASLGGAGGSGVVIVRYSLGLPLVNNASGATSITLTSAYLNGTLTSTGSSDTAVFVLWGPSNGGTNWENWAHTNVWPAPQTTNTFTIQVTNLASDATYYYRFAATNAAGTAWAPTSAVLMTGYIELHTLSHASEIGLVPGTVTVSRASTATNEDVVVSYTVSPGSTATEGTDYATLSHTVTILRGSTNASITIVPLPDLLFEDTEQVELALAAGACVIGPAATATVDIQDSPTIALDNANDRCRNGTVSASAENLPNEGKANAFDDNGGSKWLTLGQSSGWIRYHFGGDEAWVITRYTITSGNDTDTRDPRDWTLRGSHDGNTWTVVDTRSGIPSWSGRSQTLGFSCASNTTAYEYYELNISANNGDNHMQLSEIEMFGSAQLVMANLPVIENGANGATSVLPTSAILNGTLTSTGLSATAVFVFWGPNDGGTNWGDWAHTNQWDAPRNTGVFSYAATSLEANRTNYYRFAATNLAGEAWAPSTRRFFTALPEAISVNSVNGGLVTDRAGIPPFTRANWNNSSTSLTYPKDAYGNTLTGISITFPAGGEGIIPNSLGWGTWPVGDDYTMMYGYKSGTYGVSGIPFRHYDLILYSLPDGVGGADPKNAVVTLSIGTTNTTVFQSWVAYDQPTGLVSCTVTGNPGGSFPVDHVNTVVFHDLTASNISFNFPGNGFQLVEFIPPKLGSVYSFR